MYSYLIGHVDSIHENFLVLDVNNIGYDVFMTTLDLDHFRRHREGQYRVYVHPVIKEDSHSLYGFRSTEHKNLFKLLISTSGIGPKIALTVLSEMSPEQVIQAIMGNNIHPLTNISGIGKKTAERMILELRDKLKNLSVDLSTIDSGFTLSQQTIDEVKSALSALGYNPSEIARMIQSLPKDTPADTGIETLITLCLKSKSG